MKKTLPPRTAARKGKPAPKGKGAAKTPQPRAPSAQAPRVRKAAAEDPAPRRRMAAGLIVLALLVAWLAGVPGAARRPARAWRGYEILLIRPDIAQSGGLQKVARVMGPGVVSELTATVDFWDFTGLQRIPVASIDARIDPSDPRHDKAMDGIPGYFHAPSGRAGGWDIAYIPMRRSAVIESLVLVSALGLPFHGEWRLAEFDAPGVLVSAAGILALAALLAWPFRREGRARFLAAGMGALVWIPVVLSGGPALVALALLLYASWFQVVGVVIDLQGSNEKLLRGAREPLAKFLAAAGAGLVLAFMAGGFSPADLVRLAGPVASSLLLVTAMALLWGMPPGSRGRRKKFEPVPIMKTTATALRPGQAAFLLVFVVTVAVAAMDMARSAVVPRAVLLHSARGYSWDSLALLSRLKNPSRLPDLSDFVTHEAYQQTMAFGRPWKLPSRDERVYLREFSTNARDGTIVEGLRRVKVFDAAWLDSVTRHAVPGSIERMLIDQGPVAVTLGGRAGVLPGDFVLAVFVLLVFSAWFVRDRRTAPLMKGALVRLNGPARRNQVP